MNLSSVTSPASFLRALLLFSLVALGACAEIEFAPDDQFQPVTGSGEVEAFVDEGMQLSLELVDPAEKSNVTCVWVECSDGSRVRYCYSSNRPEAPSLDVMCGKIDDYHNLVSGPGEDGRPRRAAESRR